MTAGSLRLATSPKPSRRARPTRRGVTLVEMLVVVVALVVLMMTILVQIFQSATGAMSASRATQELDVNLRQIDSMIPGRPQRRHRQDDPAQRPGPQGRPTSSTAKTPPPTPRARTPTTTRLHGEAPEGQVYTARQWLSLIKGSVQTINQSVQPVAITSQVAEVMYFLRNGNLYRRVLLVAPDRSSSLYVPIAASNPGAPGYQTSIFGFPLNVSWQGVNEISCRPGPFGSSAPIPNDLGDLTNRENRGFRPRFCNDFNLADGIADDNNGDGSTITIPPCITTASANPGPTRWAT